MRAAPPPRCGGDRGEAYLHTEDVFSRNAFGCQNQRVPTLYAPLGVGGIAMFINPFEFEMYKHLDVPRHIDDAQQRSVERGTWQRWFRRREPQVGIQASAQATPKP